MRTPCSLYGNKKCVIDIIYDTSFLIGVAGFELATSASLRRRSNQAEPHPEDKYDYITLAEKCKYFF